MILYTPRLCNSVAFAAMIAALLFAAAGCATSPEEEVESGDRTGRPGQAFLDLDDMTAEDRLEAMTLRQKIGQRFVIYVPRAFGRAATTGPSRAGVDETARYISLVKATAPAGVIVYPWNYSDRYELIRLTDKLQRLSRYNAVGGRFLIAGDQEGGRVAAFRFRELPRFPSAADVARQAADPTITQREKAPGGAEPASEDALEYVRSVSYVLGRDLRSVGINMNFAPVLDLSEPRTRTIIGDRSFGTDPETVAAYGVAYADSMLTAGVIPTVKHFPGHGVTDVDSHGRLPIVEMTQEDLWTHDLVPFRAAIGADVPAIMTAHILFPSIDPEYPVTISEVFLRDILREQLDYEGVVVSDGLSMGALADNYEIDVVLERALRLDVDLILIHDRYDFLEIVERVERLIVTDRVRVSDIERGALRVLRLKERHNLLE